MQARALEEPHDLDRRRAPMMQVVLFGALLFAVAIAVFAVQNPTPVAVAFLVWRADAVATSVLVLIAATLGGGVALLLGGAREVQLRWRLRALGQQLVAAQQGQRTAQESAGVAVGESSDTPRRIDGPVERAEATIDAVGGRTAAPG
jgi:uncharacterized integral membrane protein